MQPKVISSNDLVCSQSGISHRLFLLFHTVRWMKKLFVSNCSQKAWWSQWIIIVINKIIRSLNNFCKGVFNSAIIHFYSACWQLPYFIEISMNLRNHEILKANTKTLSLRKRFTCLNASIPQLGSKLLSLQGLRKSCTHFTDV